MINKDTPYKLREIIMDTWPQLFWLEKRNKVKQNEAARERLLATDCQLKEGVRHQYWSKHHGEILMRIREELREGTAKPKARPKKEPPAYIIAESQRHELVETGLVIVKNDRKPLCPSCEAELGTDHTNQVGCVCECTGKWKSDDIYRLNEDVYYKKDRCSFTQGRITINTRKGKSTITPEEYCIKRAGLETSEDLASLFREDEQLAHTLLNEAARVTIISNYAMRSRFTKEANYYSTQWKLGVRSNGKGPNFWGNALHRAATIDADEIMTSDGDHIALIGVLALFGLLLTAPGSSTFDILNSIGAPVTFLMSAGVPIKYSLEDGQPIVGQVTGTEVHICDIDGRDIREVQSADTLVQSIKDWFTPGWFKKKDKGREKTSVGTGPSVVWNTAECLLDVDMTWARRVWFDHGSKRKATNSHNTLKPVTHEHRSIEVGSQTTSFASHIALLAATAFTAVYLTADQGYGSKISQINGIAKQAKSDKYRDILDLAAHQPYLKTWTQKIRRQDLEIRDRHNLFVGYILATLGKEKSEEIFSTAEKVTTLNSQPTLDESIAIKKGEIAERALYTIRDYSLPTIGALAFTASSHASAPGVLLLVAGILYGYFAATYALYTITLIALSMAATYGMSTMSKATVNRSLWAAIGIAIGTYIPPADAITKTLHNLFNNALGATAAF
jgi:hypothetical protein